jgi:hypothetical protein
MKRIVCAALALLFVAPAFADYVGDFELGVTLDFTIFNTYKATDGSDLQRTVAGTPSCVDGGSTTEITAGVTDTGTTAFDSSTGANKLTIVATAGNGYAAGHNYVCGFRASTLNGVTVSSLNVVSFSIENRYPLKGQILARGTLVAGSTTSVANVGATLTFSNQYVAREIWNKTTNEKQCITTTTDNGATDTVTFAPNVPVAWSNGDTFWIVIGDAPCYPVTLPAVSGAGGVYVAGYVSAGVADVDSDIGKNSNTFFKNGGALTGLTIDNVSTLLNNMPASVWNRTLEPNAALSAGCILATSLSILGGVSPGVSAGQQTYKDTSGVSTRWIGTISSGARSNVAIACP